MSAPVHQQNLQETLSQIVQSQLFDSTQPLVTDQNLFDSGLESMGIMQLIIQIEERIGVAIDDSEITRENFTSVATLAAMVERLRSKRR